MSLLGGRQEKQRAEEFTKRIEILSDVTEIPDELSSIKFSGKINERSLLIFAFGMHMKALTVTSNKAFVRSAKMQVIFKENLIDLYTNFGKMKKIYIIKLLKPLF